MYRPLSVRLGFEARAGRAVLALLVGFGGTAAGCAAAAQPQRTLGGSEKAFGGLGYGIEVRRGVLRDVVLAAQADIFAGAGLYVTLDTGPRGGAFRSARCDVDRHREGRRIRPSR